jgi:hypothetical protein
MIFVFNTLLRGGYDEIAGADLSGRSRAPAAPKEQNLSAKKYANILPFRPKPLSLAALGKKSPIPTRRAG